MVNTKAVTKWVFATTLCRKQTLLSIAIFLAACVLPFINIEPNTYAESVAYMFWGYGLGYLNITELLRFAIVRLIPVYLVCSSLSASRENGTFFRIRLYRHLEWQKSAEQTAFYIVLLFVMIQFFSCFSFFFFSNDGVSIFNFDISDYQIPFVSLLLFLVSATILEMYIAMLCFLNLYVLTANESFSFITILVLYFAVAFVPLKYYPFGMASMARLFSLTSSSMLSFGIFIAIAILIVFCLHFALKYGTRKFLLKG